MRECLQCVTKTAGDACPTPDISRRDCPCTFEAGDNYAEQAVLSTEPLVCDSGDVYPFFASTEDGDFARQSCLDGDMTFCD